MRRAALLLTICLLSTMVFPTQPRPISVMLIDGESAGSFHNWRSISPALKKVLEETKLFRVETITTPAQTGTLDGFDPKFSDYEVVVMNYDAPSERWSSSLKSKFEKYILSGGGLIVIHAADNAFSDWQAFNEMIGLGGWRGRTEKAGPHWYYRNGNLVSDSSPGNAGSHGARIPFEIELQVTNHPITEGLPKSWIHQADELYANLKGPGKNMTVLATAYSDPGNKGTGLHEPQLIVVRYGRGRIFHMTMGHDLSAVSSVDFVTLLQRGAEWVATEKVTQKVPANFPTLRTVSYRVDLGLMEQVPKDSVTH